MITFATKKMIPDLKKLWIECFGDSKEYVNFYFTYRFREDNMLIKLDHGIPVAMVSMLPAKMVGKRENITVYYIYAVGTKKEVRGRGIASSLISYCINELKRICILVPAEPALFSFYKKLGFQTKFQIKEQYVVMPSLKTCGIGKQAERDFQMIPAGAAEYKKVRDAAFWKQGYIQWDELALDYAIEEAKLGNGNAYLILINGKIEILMYHIAKGEVLIKETSLKEKNLDKVAVWLSKKLGCDTINIRLPSYSGDVGTISDFAMISECLEIEKGYFNLVLD